MTDYFVAAPIKARTVRATSGVVHHPVMPNIRENLEYRVWQVLTSMSGWPGSSVLRVLGGEILNL